MHLTTDQDDAGSIPAGCSINFIVDKRFKRILGSQTAPKSFKSFPCYLHGIHVAHLVEHLTITQTVVGSNPTGPERDCRADSQGNSNVGE